VSERPAAPHESRETGREAEGERPPLGSWARLYALVLGTFALVVLFLAWLTERFR